MSNVGMKRILAALFILTLSAPAWGEELDFHSFWGSEGNRAADMGNFVEAEKWWQRVR
jgi:hypothetical protein